MCRNRAGRIVAAAVAVPAWPPGLETAAFGPCCTCGRAAPAAQENDEIGDCPYLSYLVTPLTRRYHEQR